LHGGVSRRVTTHNYFMINFYLLLFGFLFTLLLTKFTIKLANGKRLFEANDHRKLHSEKVSALGGIPIFIGFWTMAVFMEVPFLESIALFITTGLLLLIGVEDDFKNTKVSKRLLAQILAGSIAFSAGFHFGWDSSWGIMVVNYLLTIFFVALLINSINFIDGINGLAGGFGVFAMLVLGLLFYQFHLIELMLLSIAYAVAISGFLVFNFGKQAAIFMGDNGSTVLGFIVSVFALKIVQVPTLHTIPAALPIVCSLLAIPVLDLLYVALSRMAKGLSPFVGDRNHIHHLLTNENMSHPLACGFIAVWLVGLVLILSLQTTTAYYSSYTLIIGSYLLVRIYFKKGKLYAIQRLLVHWKLSNRKVNS